MADWALISGERREGRDDIVHKLAAAWTRTGLTVQGCTQVALPGPDGPVGYDAECLWGQRLPVARPSAQPTLCGFSFVQETFDSIRGQLAERRPDITVLPGAKIESAEQGHWPAAQDVLDASTGLLVLVLRPHIVGRIAVKLPDPIAFLEHPASEAHYQRFAQVVQDAVTAQKR